MDESTKQDAQIKGLHQLLQNYQVHAMNGLGGPSAISPLKLGKESQALEHRFKEMLANIRVQTKGSGRLPYDFQLSLSPIQQRPLLLAADSHIRELSSTVLEGESIACFDIGGEKRLCLPQILNTVLKDFSLTHINQACDDLQIFCSRCSTEQLDLFKFSGVLPLSAQSCGLITKSDGERLCSLLLSGSDDVCGSERLSALSVNVCSDDTNLDIPVYHECFGEGRGHLSTKLLTDNRSKCITCVECNRQLSPGRFVGHSHRVQENRVCHWGFDRNNWRSYIHLDVETLDNQDEQHQMNTLLHSLFSNIPEERLPCPKKRKIDCSSDDGPLAKCGLALTAYTEQCLLSEQPVLNGNIKEQGRFHKNISQVTMCNSGSVSSNVDLNGNQEPKAIKSIVGDQRVRNPIVCQPRGSMGILMSTSTSSTEDSGLELSLSSASPLDRITEVLDSMTTLFLSVLAKSNLASDQEEYYHQQYLTLDSAVRMRVESRL